MRVAVVAASLWILVPFTLFVSTVVNANGNPAGALGMQLSAILFGGLGSLMVAAVALQSGRWLLTADESGIRLMRGHRRTKDIHWTAVKVIRCGPTVIQMGRYSARLGDAIRIDVHHALAPVFLDTVRFRLAADDLDRMAAVLKEIGGRHGVAVEPFPMAGRESR